MLPLLKNLVPTNTFDGIFKKKFGLIQMKEFE